MKFETMMSRYKKCIVMYLWAAICVKLIPGEVIPDSLDFQSLLRIFKSLSGKSVQASEPNITSKEFCLKSFEKASRYKKIIMLQEQVVQKLQFQHLKQIEDCSNLRHKVRGLIGNYKKVKSDLKAFKLYSG
ncbi:uncharacterized protein LOC119547875 [Drosophila subpulchrella]|uniref:uncharacterized protein LOC119547875 n=1 Tax=Drosophila subpulchrella TaxID=1486046 RepID=UPI0018A137DC|nr:uncharacterized protein LOC119547875 [Drosophila subpulchrella]